MELSSSWKDWRRLLFFGPKHKLDRSNWDKFCCLKPMKQVLRHLPLYKWQMYCRQGDEPAHDLPFLSFPTIWVYLGLVIPRVQHLSSSSVKNLWSCLDLQQSTDGDWNFDLIFGGFFHKLPSFTQNYFSVCSSGKTVGSSQLNGHITYILGFIVQLICVFSSKIKY